MKRTLYLFILSVFCVTLSAQTVSITTEVSQEKGAVKVSKKWHALEGAQVVYTVLIQDLPDTDVLDAEHQFEITNSENHTFSGNISDGFYFSKTLSEANSEDYTFDVTIKYNRVVGEVTTPVTINASAEPVHIYSTPSASFLSTEKQYLTTNHNLEFIHDGGYDNGWKFSWNDNEYNASSILTVDKPNDVPATITTTCIARNYAPDGNTLWYESETRSAQTYFYNAPTLSVSSSSESETNFYKSTGSAEWKVEVQGGGEWSIEWTGGASKETGLTYKPFSSELSTKKEASLVVRAISHADDGHELFSEELPVADIVVWPKIVTSKGSADTSTYSEEVVSFTPSDAVINYPGEWHYNWNTGDTSKTLTVAPATSQEYTITAVYKYKDNIWDEYKYTYKATVYQHPSVTSQDQLHIPNYNGSPVDVDLDQADLSYNKKEDTRDMVYMLVGEKVKLQCTPSGGTNVWKYTVKNGAETLSTTSSVEFTPTQPGTYTIIFNISNGEGVVENPWSGVITREIQVLKSSEVTQTLTYDLYSNDKQALIAPHENEGGENGWAVIWTTPTGEHPSSKIVNATHQVSKSETFTYQCNAKYYLKGFLRLNITDIYKLTYWPEPQVTGLTVSLRDKEINKVKGLKYYDLSNKPLNTTVDIDCFDGDVLEFSYTLKGGYTGEAECWQYKNTKNSEETAVTYAPSTLNIETFGDSYTANVQPAAAKSSDSFTISFVNKIGRQNNTPEKNRTISALKVNVNAWRNGQYQEELKDSIASVSWKNGQRVDVYAGGKPQNNVNFKVSHKYGYTDNGGWSYEWFEENTQRSTSDTQWTYVPTTTEESTEKNFSLHIVNRIGENYSVDKTLNYKMRVWRKAEIDGEFKLTDMTQKERPLGEGNSGIRTGNTLRTFTPVINYGYRGGASKTAHYHYEWSDLSSYTANDWSEEVNLTIDSPEKYNENRTRSLRAYIYGPYGHEWDGAPAVSHSFVVYNRPHAPQSLIKKGSGASCTMICVADVTDSDLEHHEYYLVFGYTDAQGVDHDMRACRQQNPGQVRWDNNLGEAANNSSNVPYVYALWRYPGNVEITSGRRYLNRVDDQWDGSNYDGTLRPVVAYIAPLEDVDSIEINSFDEFGVYTLDGKFVGENAHNLPTGTYIRRSMAGSSKIIIR